MSLRIQNDASSGVASSEVGRTGQANSIAGGAGKSRSVSGSESGDHVQISSGAESISAAVSAQNSQRASRVAQLSALYSSGQYGADSGRVSHALIGSAVTGTAAGKA